jgi:hypothetical protein
LLLAGKVINADAAGTEAKAIETNSENANICRENLEQ